MVGYHDFAARQFSYRMVLGWPDGWTLRGGQLTDDQSEFMKFQRLEMAAVFAVISFAAACLTIILLEAASYIGPLLHPEPHTTTGKLAVEPKKFSRRLNLARLWYSHWPERCVLATGLVLLLGGSLCILVPTPVAITQDEAVFQMGGPLPSRGLLSAQLSSAQIARIVVEFDRNATARREVGWGLTTGKKSAMSAAISTSPTWICSCSGATSRFPRCSSSASPLQSTTMGIIACKPQSA